MEISAIIGFTAAICTTSGFLPQAFKIIKTKSTKDISLMMYLVLWLGTLLWLIYGIVINELPVIVANTISLSFISTIVILKLWYK